MIRYGKENGKGKEKERRRGGEGRDKERLMTFRSKGNRAVIVAYISKVPKIKIQNKKVKKEGGGERTKIREEGAKA